MKTLDPNKLKKLPVWNRRMFQLMEYCISTKKAEDREDFLKSIGFEHVTNMHRILNASSPGMSFQHIHFYNASRKYKVSMDWFFGNTNIMHLSQPKRKSITNLLNEALIIAKEIEK